MNFQEIERIVLNDGWTLKTIKGSHHQYVHPMKPGKVTIPHNRRQIMKLTYPAIFYEGEGGYTVEVPDLPGCASGGASLAEAIIMETDAAAGWVLTGLEDGKPVPKASPVEAIHPDPGGFVSVLVLDMDAYAEKYGNKAVRKNLTIPAWLNTFAERKHINFSQVLQDSLTAIYEQENAAS
jgi:predicted RNase H-like HicB family nuclease